MNIAILTGRLTKDPDIHVNGDKKIARYTLAVDRRGKQGEADFIGCVCFDKRADFAEKYLKKGTKINVQGMIRTGSYKNKDGATVYTTDVYVNEQEFCESRREAQSEPADTFTTDTKSSAPRGSQDGSQLDGFLPLDGYQEELPFK